MEESNEEEKRNILQVVIKQIIYGKETIRIELFYLPAIDTGTSNRTELLPIMNAFRTFSIEVDNFLVKCLAVK
jgi:hypothetical protein